MEAGCSSLIMTNTLIKHNREYRVRGIKELFAFFTSQCLFFNFKTFPWGPYSPILCSLEKLSLSAVAAMVGAAAGVHLLGRPTFVFSVILSAL